MLARGGNQLAEDELTPFSVTEILESVMDIVRPMAEETEMATPLALLHNYPHVCTFYRFFHKRSAW